MEYFQFRLIFASMRVVFNTVATGTVRYCEAGVKLVGLQANFSGYLKNTVPRRL